jgi:hypothetical protein
MIAQVFFLEQLSMGRMNWKNITELIEQTQIYNFG